MNFPSGDFSEFDIEAIRPSLEKLEKESVYLEIGVKHGRSLAVARYYSSSKVYGIDIENNLDQAYFKDKKITFINEPSEEVAKKWKKSIDLLLIDGDHSFEGVESDLRGFYFYIRSGGQIFFHDADITSPGVLQAILYFLHFNSTWSFPIIYKKLLNKNTSMVSIKRLK